jgi:Ribbon-helix-helix protein, copG family
MPESVAAATTAAAQAATVNRRSRRGVTQDQPRAASQARSPLAPPTAAAAVAMHWVHMTRSMARAIPVYTGRVAKVMISLPDDLLARIDERARRHGTTRSGLLRELAKQELRSDSATRSRAIHRLLSTAGEHGGRGAAEVRKQRRAR